MKRSTKKILAAVLALVLLHQYVAQAQCTFTLNGASPPFFICNAELGNTGMHLEGTPAGGSFSGAGIYSSLSNGEYYFNPTIGVIVNPNFNPFNITYTAPNGCTITLPITVDVPSQTATQNIINSPNGAPFYCENTPPFQLSGNVGNAGVFLVNGLPPVNNIFNPQALGVGAHLVTYTYQDPANGCVSIDERTYNVQALPDMTPHAQADSDPAYENIEAQYCFNSLPILLIGAGDFYGPGVTATQTFDPSAAGIGTHTIKHIYSDIQGICRDTLEFTIEVIPGLTGDFTSIAALCYNQLDTLVYTGDPITDTNAVFNWTIDGGSVVENKGDTAIIEWASSGAHNVTLTVTNTLCPLSSFSKTIVKSEASIFAGDDLTAEVNTAIQLLATGVDSEGNPISNFSWASNPATTLSCEDCGNPIAVLQYPTTFIVTGTTAEGCTASDTLFVQVTSDRDVFVPNAFSPNFDNKNDRLWVFGKGIKSGKISVFDRWGEMVYQSEDLSEGWDGNYRDKPVNSGVYIYVVDITFYDDETTTRRGSVTLLR